MCKFSAAADYSDRYDADRTLPYGEGSHELEYRSEMSIHCIMAEHALRGTAQRKEMVQQTFRAEQDLRVPLGREGYCGDIEVGPNTLFSYSY